MKMYTRKPLNTAQKERLESAREVLGRALDDIEPTISRELDKFSEAFRLAASSLATIEKRMLGPAGALGIHGDIARFVDVMKEDLTKGERAVSGTIMELTRDIQRLARQAKGELDG